MALIFESENFILESYDHPFVSRTDGGNLRLLAKDQSITDRTKLTPAQAIEFMRLSIAAGEALQTVMNKQGIPVVKINYHDMGNWAFKDNKKPVLHMHIFGRAKNAIHQPFPGSVLLPFRETGFYDNFEPLANDDVQLIKLELQIILSQGKFHDSNWHL